LRFSSEGRKNSKLGEGKELLQGFRKGETYSSEILLKNQPTNASGALRKKGKGGGNNPGKGIQRIPNVKRAPSLKEKPSSCNKKKRKGSQGKKIKKP